ncbi:MAG: heavy metal translocating P-type ATPase, partial [Halobacteriales archaeon SW_8_66_22]
RRADAYSSAVTRSKTTWTSADTSISPAAYASGSARAASAADAIAAEFAEQADNPRTDGGESSQEHRPAETGDVEGFESHTTGVSGGVDGSDVLVGHPDLFVERGWGLPAEIQQRAERAREASRLPVVVGREGRAEGLLVLEDQPRAEWDRTLDRLADRDVDAVVLTGDDERSADQFAEHTAVRNVFAGVPPAGKTETVRALQAGSDHVTMVGDGTNDAPALAQSDLGIALGSGTALASDAAELAIVGDDLSAIETVFDLASGARRRVTRNTAIALLYNAFVLPFVVAGMLNPLVTTVAVALSGGLLAANSSRRLLQ